jgi:hypothetical protein
MEKSEGSLEERRNIAVWGCKACAEISKRAEQRNDTQLMIRMLDEGVCEALVKAMNNFCETSVEVATFACMTIEVLARASRDLREFLGELGACESVIYALSLHIGNPEISEFGAAAVRQLADGNISNSFRLAEAGACDVLVQTGNFGFNLRHERSGSVSAHVCEAISQLCEASNRTKLLDSGACEVVVSLLRFHTADVVVARATLTAICGLASMTDPIRSALSQCKCPALIVDAAHVHSGDTVVLLKACEAAMHMSLLPSAAVQFEASGGCEMLAEALGGLLMEKDFGPEVCCSAMLQIVQNSGLSGSIAVVSVKIKLINADAVGILKRVAFSSRATQRAREHAKDLLHMLQDYDPSHAGAAVSASASASAAKAGRAAAMPTGVSAPVSRAAVAAAATAVPPPPDSELSLADTITRDRNHSLLLIDGDSLGADDDDAVVM